MIEVNVQDQEGTELGRWYMPSVPMQGDRISLPDATVRRVIHSPLWFPPNTVVLTVGPA